MADTLWHETDEQTSGWPDAPHTRKGSPREKESQSYPAPGISPL